MKISNFIKTAGTVIAISAVPLMTKPLCACAQERPDTFERAISPSGSIDSASLKGAPNPQILINGNERIATIVIDIESNILYKYNTDGSPETAYLIASGKKSSPTQKGIRVVTHTETYPYNYAPVNTKRRKNPNAYGPKIICLNKIDPQNGEQSQTGQFIHGNNDASSIGKYASLGCIRMDNEVIKKLAQEVKRGDIVIIK